MCKVATIIGKNFNYYFPEPHPFNNRRYEKFLEIVKKEKIIKVNPRIAKENELLLFHKKEYLEFVKKLSKLGYGYLDYGDTPAFKKVFEASCYVVGASLKALELVFESKYDHAFNPVGGLHHAFNDRAAGFCVFNDIAVIIEYARKKLNLKNFLYVDIDAHHGDGVFYSYEEDPNVYIVDFHEDGKFLFPGTGFESEKGKGKAYGTKLNICLNPFSTTEDFLKRFEEAKKFIEEREFDLIIFQCGADCLENDPIAHLKYSSKVHEKVAKFLHYIAHKKCNGKIIALGGGGYNADNIAKAWISVIKALSTQL